MPGMSFIYDSKGDLVQQEAAILQSLDSMIHTDEYKREILLTGQSYLLACTRYKEYPATSFESGDLFIYLEGQIYGKGWPSIKRELTDLAERMLKTETRAREQVTEWLLNTDGDFIVFVFHRKLNQIAIMNDALSRLPLYYYNTNGLLIISRETRFVASIIRDTKFDRMAIAQYLLFGFPLGKRTLLENLHRLEPATLVRINLNKSESRINNLRRLNFEDKKYSGRTIRQNGIELASLFCEACKNRDNKASRNILSLSGGLDSRSVAAGLHNSKIAFSAVTYLDCSKATILEARIAEQLANAFSIDWALFQLPFPKGKDLLKLLRIQNGLNSLGMSDNLPFFDKIKETYGSGVTLFTGDGGDQLLQHDFRPSKSLKCADDLVKYTISTSQLSPLDSVASLTGIREPEIIEELENHILSYPEKQWDQKYIHFITCEVGLNWYFPGEDRNRCYFWSVTPFYSIQFFDYAMNCPDKHKSQYALYRQFLSELSPQAAAIDYGGAQVLTPVPIISIRFRIMRLMIAILNKSPNLKKRVARAIMPITSGSYVYDSNIINCLRKQITNCKIIGDYLSYSAIDCILKNCNNYDKRQIEELFTITSYIEELEYGKSTIEEYYDSEFT